MSTNVVLEMSTEAHFNQVAEAVDESCVAVVKDSFDQSKVIDLKEFYDVYRQEQIALDKEYALQSEATATPPTLTLELFSDAFKYLDEFPNNLQKPKKLPRLYPTLSKSVPSLNDSFSTSLNSIKLDGVPKPSDTYKNFQKFIKQLKYLTVDISQQDIEGQYSQKLKQLHNFAQKLEKIVPKEVAAGAALTEDEEKVIEDLVDKMEDMNFIRGNQDIFRANNSNGVVSNSQRMEILIDILSQTFVAVNS